MDDTTIAAVVAEITPLIIGRSAGKIFQITAQSLAIDFGLRSQGYLFISGEPAQPRMYLIRRRVRDLEKQSIHLGQFGLTLRKELSNTKVSSIAKTPGDRIVWFNFRGVDEIGAAIKRSLVAQLTGRSANVLLLDEEHRIVTQLRAGQGAGQTAGTTYQSPPTQHTVRKPGSVATERHKSVSESLDEHYQALTARQACDSRLASARAQLTKEISRRKKLLRQLEEDLSDHANAENEKRVGDLLLANVGSLKRTGSRVLLSDYFAEGAPTIEIEVDGNLTIPEEASRRFESYARSKRARKQITNRIDAVSAEIAKLKAQSIELESNPQTVNAPTVIPSPASKQSPDSLRDKKIPGTRRYFSSDGYEILVGRAARDNDHLTFKIAAPNDLWLHAADYPGSHVIVRNPTRKEIPHRTLVEAAQLAAHFSQANKDPKVDIHYTQRKFVSKIKGSAPGLVRLLRFKTIIVAPREAGERVK